MSRPRRLVLDTNVPISAVLRNGSIPHRALLKARIDGVLLTSDETVEELSSVLLREKFDLVLDRALRKAAIEEFARLCTLISIPSPIRACRDPRDDKFLEVAVHGRADVIISGDSDLLILNPFAEIAIITPHQYLEQDSFD